MLNFKSTSILFIIAVSIVGLLCYFFEITLWWLLFPILVYKVFLIYGSASISSNFYINTHCNSDTAEKQIAITFDAGPDTTITPKVLAVLTEYNVPATFFVIGKNISGNEKLLKQIDAAGHIIGNHTFSHSFFIDFKSTH